jgi:hypothetical protein
MNTPRLDSSRWLAFRGCAVAIFSWSDAPGSQPVVLVSDSLARMLEPDGNVVAQLRIIDDDLWNQVKSRQAAVRALTNRRPIQFKQARRCACGGRSSP